ncbi:MAG: hypothetical protein HY747_04640 [Elusimicrobia bacterium]|nr:hypothetical protein [Elusimicrobiota bacterium]
MKKDFYLALGLTVFLMILAGSSLAGRLAAWRAVAWYLVNPAPTAMAQAQRHAYHLGESWEKLFEARRYLDTLEKIQAGRDLENLRQSLAIEEDSRRRTIEAESQKTVAGSLADKWQTQVVEIVYRGIGESDWVSQACVSKQPAAFKFYAPALQFYRPRGEFILAGRLRPEPAGQFFYQCFELVTSPRHAAAVILATTGEAALLAGLGRPDRLRLSYLPLDSKAAVGERVMTSAASSVYPPGLAVGEIVEIEPLRSSQLFKTAYVRPYLDLARLERLVVLKPEEF